MSTFGPARVTVAPGTCFASTCAIAVARMPGLETCVPRCPRQRIRMRGPEAIARKVRSARARVDFHPLDERAVNVRMCEHTKRSSEMSARLTVVLDDEALYRDLKVHAAERGVPMK